MVVIEWSALPCGSLGLLSLSRCERDRMVAIWTESD
jgi:hypothetical protein